MRFDPFVALLFLEGFWKAFLWQMMLSRILREPISISASLTFFLHYRKIRRGTGEQKRCFYPPHKSFLSALLSPFLSKRVRSKMRRKKSHISFALYIHLSMSTFSLCFPHSECLWTGSNIGNLDPFISWRPSSLWNMELIHHWSGLVENRGQNYVLARTSFKILLGPNYFFPEEPWETFTFLFSNDWPS